MTGMNLRHAAALALVGWYLMVPSARNSCRYGEENFRPQILRMNSDCLS
jgi:hypothetical protein